MKFVIFTVLIDNYDWLNQISNSENNFDAICYTNNEKLLKKSKFRGWKIEGLEKYYLHYKLKNLEKKNQIITRWYKFNPHIHLKNYSYSLYLDAKIELKKNIFELIYKTIKKDFSIGIFKHPHRVNLRQEICHCYWNKKVNSKEFRILKNLYFKELKFNNYKDDKLFENGIRFTNHRSKAAQLILNDTFKLFEIFPYRDQIILPIILQKYKKFKSSILTFETPRKFIRERPHKVKSFKNLRRFIIANSNNKLKKFIFLLPNFLLKIIELLYDYFQKRN